MIRQVGWGGVERGWSRGFLYFYGNLTVKIFREKGNFIHLAYSKLYLLLFINITSFTTEKVFFMVHLYDYFRPGRKCHLIKLL